MTVSAIPPVLTLVSPDKSVPPAKLQPVAAALAIQVARDFAKPWHATAAVTTGKHPGAWEIRVQRDISEPGALGVHLDDGHQPYALVALTKDWSKTASHEALEMLADPWGNRLVAAHLPSGEAVRALVEVCDPCEAKSYPIGGVAVSDLMLPAYYRQSRRGVPTTYMGQAIAPMEVAAGGYVSFEKPDGSWWQTTWWGTGPETRQLGASLAEIADDQLGITHPRSIREVIDAATRPYRNMEG